MEILRCILKTDTGTHRRKCWLAHMKIHTSFDKGRQKGIKKDIHIADIRSLLISYLSKKDWLFYKTEREPETVKHRLQECPMQYTWLSSDHHSHPPRTEAE